MSLAVTDKEIERLKKKLGYKGCRNCDKQIGSLRMCKWAESGGDGRLHFICPQWVKRKEVEK